MLNSLGRRRIYIYHALGLTILQTLGCVKLIASRGSNLEVTFSVHLTHDFDDLDVEFVVEDLIAHAFEAAKVHLSLLEFEILSKKVDPSLNLFNDLDKFRGLLLQDLWAVGENLLKLLIVLVVLEVFSISLTTRVSIYSLFRIDTQLS